MIVNVLHMIGSVFFAAGAIVDLSYGHPVVFNCLYLAGSIFFLVGTTIAMIRK